MTNSLFAARANDGTQYSRDRVHEDAQSLSFYSDISRFITERLPASETPLSLLDIGPRTGSGLALLRLMHHPLSYAAVKFDPVTGIDMDPQFVESAASYPDIEALCGDAFALPDNRKWDVVMSSHTIEHVNDPSMFLDKMSRLARRMVVVACPFEEQNLIRWHLNSINYHLLSEHGFHDMQVYRSPHWFNSMCVIASRCF